MLKLKYSNYDIVCQEIPNEISLAINLTNCPHRCEGCHSPFLRENFGTLIDNTFIDLIESYKRRVTCVCFMGGDAQHEELSKLIFNLKLRFPNLKFAVYSGDDEIDGRLIDVLDYYKVGSGQADKGPLSSVTTNQQLFSITPAGIEDITSLFWKVKK